jgi:tetratricopeptide (TPR) repeat protein
MRQAITPACLFSFCSDQFPWSLFQEQQHLKQMSRDLGTVALSLLSLSILLSGSSLAAQQPKTAPTVTTGSVLSTEKAFELAEQGHCQEAIPGLKRAMSVQTSVDTRKQAGVVGIRCSLALDNQDSTTEFIRLLTKQFPHDPDVLFIVVHAYSDLSSRTAQELARIAPQSLAAHKLNAEAYEMQGNWSEAQREYETMIAKEPNAPGIHFLLGRLLLSKPGADPDAMARAKQEFQKELAIDPNNAGAHYILGELARREDNCDEAIPQFSQAAKLDRTFADAYLGWGFCLVTLKRYEEAIPPLRAAERLTPGNPMVHYSLATALNLTGQKAEADKEFAIHRSLTTAGTPRADDKPH